MGTAEDRAAADAERLREVLHVDLDASAMERAAERMKLDLATLEAENAHALALARQREDLVRREQSECWGHGL